ncbi:MAG: hypothetical protein EAZ95_14450 [Bacteroidetes bacterium]|nr:MAG: hypothetical protein EAZ95_14450 [Bacteroidota bacterium]
MQKKNYTIRFLAEGFLEEAIIKFCKIPPNLIENTKSMQALDQTMLAIHEIAYNCVVVGLVDNDRKNVPDYFSEFVEDTSKTVPNLAYKEHPEKPHILIVVSPAMEKWLLETAERNGVNIENYGFPSDLKSLKKHTKKLDIIDNKPFKNFLTELLDKSPELQTLKEWLQELKQKALPDYGQDFSA